MCANRAVTAAAARPAATSRDGAMGAPSVVRSAGELPCSESCLSVRLVAPKPVVFTPCTDRPPTAVLVPELP